MTESGGGGGGDHDGHDEREHHDEGGRPDEGGRHDEHGARWLAGLDPHGAHPEHRRRMRKAAVLAVLRSVLTVLVLGVAYFVMPLEGFKADDDIPILVVSLIAIVLLVLFQVGRIVRADYPGLRAIEALAFTASLLLFVFAVTYDVMDAETSGAFNVALTRLDSLYFTVTVFGTVGFGDITAHSPAARSVVTVQILFDFVFLGVAVRVIASAVQIGRQRVSRR
ncbi:hypothetical protein KDL01_33635 [Actinospica durhamensis]|uniref:Potassium channel domain-containing protein n=1 Tax=Actinospica durhamensis TaxID=1508375 RepID=A0A941EXL6_9ACTN|nr:potassium channel family protein [Actinospica durhamensis]MBR7838263.1 hypothetical protein [Actinospica durhamensis]